MILFYLVELILFDYGEEKDKRVYIPIPDDILTLQDEYIKLVGDIKKLEDRKAELQNAILLSMQSNNLKKAENDYIRVSYIAPSVRKVFDNAKFQEEHADLYEKYVVNSETKPSIRISIKTENL